MLEQEILINQRNDSVVGRKLAAILSPWSNIPKDQLPELMAKTSIPLIELARSAHVSPQKALREVPRLIEINGQNFRVARASRINSEGIENCTNHFKINLRLKKLIRDSVKEPTIQGMRNGKMRLNKHTLKRKIEQARLEREQLIFQAIDLFNKDKTTIQRRNVIHERLSKRFMRKSESQGIENKILINEADENLKILQSLVHVNVNDIQRIVQNALNDSAINLFDFSNMLGLSTDIQQQINENHRLLDTSSPPDRQIKVNLLKNVIENTPTLNSLSKERIHPATSFEKGVPLFFGMGGGSQIPCQGLPLDVLKMVLTGEKLRRKLNLSNCFVLGADVITYTNIGRTPEFTKDRVDQVIDTEVAILNEIFKRFNFFNWKAIKQSQLAEHFSSDKVITWKQNIAEADAISFVGGHHYAIEMSDIQLLVPNGIKLGWWIRPLTKNTGYIMDEQPFHARFALVMALLGKPHATTLLYTHAGSRIILGQDGLLQKEAPYITYTPDRRLLLSPFENIGRKLEWAEKRNGGLTIPFVKKQMSAIVSLFEELVTIIPNQGKTENDILTNKLQFIVDQGVGNDSRISQMWRAAFPNAI